MSVMDLIPDDLRSSIRNVYDIMAVCYISLMDDLKSKQMSDRQFLSYYIEKTVNPAHTGGTFSETEEKRYRLSLTVRDMATFLRSSIKEIGSLNTSFGIRKFLMNLPAHMQHIEEQLLPLLISRDVLYDIDLYIILLACDNYAQEDSDSRYLRGSSGPLNHILTDRVRLFFARGDSLVSPAIRDLNIPLQGPHTPTIRDKFSAVCFVTNEQIDKSHNLYIYANRFDDAFDYIRNHNNILKVAVVPFTGKGVTCFPMVEGTAEFTVQHSDEYIKEGIASIKRIMYKALEVDCNIIIFPEFMIEKEMIDAIKEVLLETQRNSLLFVAAGTRWTPENANELLILDRTGNEIARHHKYAPFSEERSPGDGLDPVRMTEHLAFPGKYLSLLDIKDIGRFAFAICRDVCIIEEDTAAILNYVIEELKPHFLIVPAWSSSIDTGFLNQFEVFGRHQVISVLCNCCEPIALNRHHNEYRILIGSPCKDNPKKSGVNGKTQSIKCDVVVDHECSHKDCFFTLNLHMQAKNFHSQTKIVESDNKDRRHYFDP